MSEMPPGPAAPRPASDDPDQHWITLNRLAISGAFVSGLAHELNNPLQVVTGTVELLLARHDLPPDVVMRLERVLQQVNRASATLLDVVGFVRDRSPSPARIDLRNVIERVLGLRKYPLARAAITVVADLPTAGTAVVTAKPSELAQALLNLVMNAESALAGRQQANLSVSVDLAAGLVRLRVADNGPGVAPEMAERVFEPFVSSRAPDLAAGIGLTAAAALATRNGGRLLRENVASGASFVIELPLAAS